MSNTSRLPEIHTDTDVFDSETTLWTRALRAVVVLWGCELVLARVSCDPQVFGDMAVSAIALGIAGLLPLALVVAPEVFL